MQRSAVRHVSVDALTSTSDRLLSQLASRLHRSGRPFFTDTVFGDTSGSYVCICIDCLSQSYYFRRETSLLGRRLTQRRASDVRLCTEMGVDPWSDFSESGSTGQ